MTTNHVTDDLGMAAGVALGDMLHAALVHARSLATREQMPLTRAAMLTTMSVALQLSAHCPEWWAMLERGLRDGPDGLPAADVPAERAWAREFAATHPFKGVTADG